VVTDDLDVPTAQQLTGLLDLVANQGMAFTRAYASMPVCGPARASILTGQYPHNHGVVSNHPPLGGFPAFRRHESATIATWLHGAGYRTAHIGKYINDYPIDSGDGYIPPGWDDWYGHLSAYEDGRFFNYWVNDNGIIRRYGDQPEDYSADVETLEALEFIHDSAGRPEPIFLYLAPEAPHVPANYPMRHGKAFKGARAPRVPSFNESDVRDKPSHMRQKPQLTDPEIAAADKLQTWRLRSMLAVEDMIREVIQALSVTGRLDNSYVVFTSDNGLLMGQHRRVARKKNVYEETIRVPLMVRGPGVRVGVASHPVQLIDLAPTLLELAGAPVPDSVDGRSLVPFLRGSAPESWRTDVLIHLSSTRAIRTPDWLYAEIGSGDLELYDMRADPYQLESLHDDVSPEFLEPFRTRMRALLECQGSSCHP
jgi:arylsulfatase A-like enzyme